MQSMKEKIKANLQTHVQNTEGLIGIQAGHFALIHGENKELIPLITKEIKGKYAHHHMAKFALETWKLGVELAKYALEQGKKVKLIVLVNDWQFVKKAKFGEENEYRKSFYQTYQIPKVYLKELQKYGLDEKWILSFKTQNGKINHSYLFSEMKLRSRYKNYYKKQCSLEHGCAQEFLPLIHEGHQQGMRLFYNFIPFSCELPVTVGTQQAKNIINEETLKIINVFCSGNTADFWERYHISVVDEIS